MTNIYILKLENDKYYVGKTNNLELRLKNHFKNNGSLWTKRYKPQEILEIINNCDEFDEDKYTIKMMKKHGIDNVRGGSFCKFILSNDNINTIKQMIIFNSDKCYICEKEDHFGNKCPYRKRKIENEVEKNIVAKKRKIDDKEEMKEEMKENCIRCYRIGHNINNCYAKKYKNGKYIKDSIHEEDQDKIKNMNNNEESDENKRKKIKLCCNNCGKNDHKTNNCLLKQ
jgi:predicted GIY-YIG superfamily endonuclease